MPIYEYRCQNCNRKTSIFWRSLSAIDERKARCDRCGSARLIRLMPRVRVVRGGGSDRGPSGDVDDAMMNEMAGLDENDPRSMARFMRKMAQETGEDMGPEFDEVVGRLEKGEDPEKIEQSMGDMFGDDPTGGMGGMGSIGMDDDYGGPPEDPTAKADKEAEAKDKKATEKRRTVAMKGKANKEGKKTGMKAKKVSGKSKH